MSARRSLLKGCGVSRILGLETSGNPCSVAVVSGGSVASELLFDARGTLSVSLLTRVQQTLDAAGVAISEVGGLGVAIGPGSWTGLRIGVATSRALAQSLALPVVGVKTTAALARQVAASEGCLVVTVLPYRKEEVYVEAFRDDAPQQLRGEGQNPCHLEEMIEALKAVKEPVVLCGAAVGAHRTRLREELGQGVTLLDPAMHPPRASTIALLAAERLAAGEGDDPMRLTPHYLAPSQAERVKGIVVT